MVLPSGDALLPANLPIRPVMRRRDGGGGYENRLLIPLLLATSALLFFVTYHFGLAAAGAVVAVFFVFALAAHRVRLSRRFPFLHLSPGAAGSGVRRGGGVGEEEGVVLVFPAGTAGGNGMDAAAISALPAAFGYKRDGGGGAHAAATGWAQCAICLGLVRAGEAVRRLPACGHLFHAGCIEKWLRAHATCPLCRATVAAGEPEVPV
ncbi:hypothetical protein HU200_015276 [Digitaria exilis]|uniref:RING-type E3 ubiquitin transferase n=1 Tax=Digitaria exilis TaxID=1010633 RepID=A0A835KJJ8_9POAL|nr:hypothetical protein HU200_015276 [Digitaria exilis]CAB3469547.1 unnamed protein product [Digitaria exilis]